MIENCSASRASTFRELLCFSRLSFVFTYCLIFLSMSSLGPVSAQANKGYSQEPGVSSAPDSPKALKGQIKASELAVESSLKELGDTLHHLKDSAWS